jgi:hypothetical protein
MNKWFLLVLFSFCIYGCDNCKNSEKQLYFYKSIMNTSTSPDFIVLTVIDGNSNLSKEICCGSNQFCRACLNEGFKKYGIKNATKFYDEVLESKNCEHKFEFTDKMSLETIGFFEYNPKIVDSISTSISKRIIDKIVKAYNPKEHLLLENFITPVNKYLIHALYRDGIYCSRDDISGYTVIKKILK